jgi:CBS domain-containing protein
MLTTREQPTARDRLTVQRDAEEVTGAPWAVGGVRVRDVMGPARLLLDADLPLHTAAVLLHDLQLSGAPVVAADGEVIGVVSQRELLDSLLVPALAAQDPRAIRRWWDRSVADVCASPARTTTPGASVLEAAADMLDGEVGRLVVVEGARVVGMVTHRDVLAAVVSAHRGELRVASVARLAIR